MGKLNLEDLGRSDLLFGPQKAVYEAKNTQKKFKKMVFNLSTARYSLHHSTNWLHIY